MTPTAPNRLAAGWFTLALGALGLSALFAVLLVVARMPFLGQGAAVFRTALVLHVDLAVLVWFLAMAAGAWSLTSGATGAIRWIILALAAAGALAMLGAALPRDALPILANYVPLLDHPIFLTGLAVFAIAIALAGAFSLPGLLRSAHSWRLGAMLAAIALLVAALVLGIDAVATSSVEPIGIDDLLWGTGHAIQFVHVLMMMGAWLALGESVVDVAPLRRHLPWVYAIAFVPVLAAPVIAVMAPVGSVEYRLWFTQLMRWGSWPGAALLCVALSVGLTRRWNERPLTPDEKGLAISLLLFTLGCIMGATIHGDSLSVPAHYHGTVGAVTLAYLLWLRRLAPAVGVAPERLSAMERLPAFYGIGVALLVAGLALAGQLGVPRKTPHIDLAVDNGGYFAAMALAGVGGFIALTAVATIVFLGFRAAWRSRRSPASRRDVRGAAIAATLVLVAGGGWLLDILPGGERLDDFSPRRHAAQKIRADVQARFEQGVVMLHAKQYDHALTAFHRVLQLAPEMPEAYVNTGFALIGLKRFKEARDFFEGATALRRNQVNAYYGLAVALEGMGDLPGAVGAMQTYLHLAKADDPFRIKAEAALWEWREQLKARSPQP